MNPRTLINKTIILSVFALAGWLLARSIYYGSAVGVVLAVVAIVAWTYFLYQLHKMQNETETAEEYPGN